MTQKKKFLRLDSLVAYVPTETDGDEIFVKYNDKKVAPKRRKFIKMTKEPAPLDVEIELDAAQQWVELELWDYDLLSPNDTLGKFRLFVEDVGENFTAELIKNETSDGRYVLNWSVIERLKNNTPKARK